MNDPMSGEGPVSSLHVFEDIPSLSVYNKPLPTQKERMAAMVFAGAETSNVAAKLLVKQALRPNLPSATQYHF